MDRMDRRTYLALVAGGALALAGCARASAERQSTRGRGDESRGPQTTASQSPESPESYGLGDRFGVGDLDLVVYGADVVDRVDAPSDDDPFELDTESDENVLAATDGSAFAVVDVAVQHARGKGVVDVDRELTVALGDGTDRRYAAVRALRPEARAVTAGRLAPGEVVRGDLAYEVGDDVRDLVVEVGPPGAGPSAVVGTGEKRSQGVGERLQQDLQGVHEFSQGVERGGVEVRIASLERGNDLGGFLDADDGEEVVVLGVTVDNTTNRELRLSPAQLQLKDESGRVYDASSTMVGALGDLSELSVAAEEKEEGEVGYRVDEGSGELYWLFDFGEWGTDQRVAWLLR
ncbi:DUF4352 domain-containing protein [Halomarina salina]|uniref:DUF4352 domain-containing protein n=1 Tax=Halomarina salina TaxID=1872699 RepID=A0ABD5RK21_9EURY|nr:DUF4352 domain-containing protein [Halomarina salina]